MLALIGAVCTSARADSIAPATGAELAPTQSLEALAHGTRSVLVSDVPTAENLLFLADGRLLVSGDKGLYQLTRDPSGAVRARNLAPAAPCAFGAMVEVRGLVYANCYDFFRAFVYVSPLEPLAFTEAVEVASTSMANGLASDGEHLYLSATLQSKIVRISIDPDDGRRLFGQTLFVSGLDAPLPNGLKVHEGALYWNDLMAVKVMPLDRSRRPSTLVVRPSVLDDLQVDTRGLVVADYLGNVLVAYDATGQKRAETPQVFRSPSAVAAARGRFGLGPDDLVVTERGGGVVSVYRPHSISHPESSPARPPLL